MPDLPQWLDPSDVPAVVLPPEPNWLPDGVIAESFARVYGSANAAVLISGTLACVGNLVVPAGKTVSTITVGSNNTGATTPANQWFALIDALTRAVLGVTVDDGANAWLANAEKTLALTAPWTAPADTKVYAGILVNAAAVPTLRAASSYLIAAADAPQLSGPSNAGLTNPASLPSPVAALGAVLGTTPYVRLG